MTEPHSRSLCLALGRMRFAIVAACWVIALALFVQIIVWSLCAFTELRFADPEAAEAAPLVVDSGSSRAKPPPKVDQNARWRPGSGEEQEGDSQPLSIFDRVFKIAVNAARTLGLMSALVICPLLALGVILAVPAGAPKVERAVNAMCWATILVLLIMPLGGWFGLAWNQGTITDYAQMMDAVARAREEGFGLEFYARFLVLPVVSIVGFVMVAVQFSSAVVAVLVRRDMLDPELEKEASNIAATSLHATGRTAGALNRALDDDRAKAAKRKKKAATPSGSGSLSKVSPGNMPKRLI